MRNTKLWILALLPLCACSAPGYEHTPTGIVVNIKQDHPLGAKKVKLDVVSDKIIHVTATPENKFANDSSLIIVPQANTPAFDVTDQDSLIVLSTASLRASVNKGSGKICFYDKDGKEILQESNTGDKGSYASTSGRFFSPITVEGTKGYTIRQMFKSADDEAFYGLGQHQADEFNYKGKDESLFQYNTKVSVPFILSTKNYGILWDNYSLSRFGNADDYWQLDEAFTLYDETGNLGGLTVCYKAADNRTPPVSRVEKNVYYEDLKTIQNLPKGFPLQGAFVTYDGTLEPKESGTYRLNLYYAGYVKVYLNDELVVPERWRTAWNPNSYKFTADLQEGVRTPIRIEWKPDGAQSYLGLRTYMPVDEAEQNKLSIFSEMGKQMNYYFVYGEDMDEVISGYRTLTGKAPIMPKWAMGFWQSRERYKTQDEIVNTLKEFRQRRMPIDNIVLDWSYWPEDAWGSHEFDKTRFPDPKKMLDDIHGMNAQMMISVWPKFYMNTTHFKEFDDNGWMYQQAVKDSIRDWIGPGYIGSFYDAYAYGARKLFWKQLKEHLYPLGIDAWWMDASEPNVRDCTDMDYRKALCGPTALGPSTEYFNAYALMNAQAIYTGLREEDPNKRVFQLTRSGFAGLQRYATATWSGDIATRWEDMKAQISAGLNFAMSGIPYWTMDIGGFCVESRYEKAQYKFNATGKENEDLKEWRELNTRWYQFGAFSPLFRAHGQYPFREVFNIAPESHSAYQSIKYYINLRYNLMPYIYSLAGMTYHNDYTIMRALVLDFGKEAENIGDQFMFGPALMVCPVYEYGARTREVYFPSTGWYDFYSGAYQQTKGAVGRVDAPYTRMPLFVRAGSIIPFGPDIQYTDEKPADSIALYVYAGADGAFTLYEDEGVNYNYEKGAYAQIPMNYDEATRTLTIGDRQGTFDGMLKERTFNVVMVDEKNPKPFNIHTKGKTVKYDGRKQQVTL